MTAGVVNLKQKLSSFSERWSPRVVAEMNDYQFKLVKLQGESSSGIVMRIRTKSSWSSRAKCRSGSATATSRSAKAR